MVTGDGKSKANWDSYRKILSKNDRFHSKQRNVELLCNIYRTVWEWIVDDLLIDEDTCCVLQKYISTEKCWKFHGVTREVNEDGNKYILLSIRKNAKKLINKGNTMTKEDLAKLFFRIQIEGQRDKGSQRIHYLSNLCKWLAKQWLEVRANVKNLRTANIDIQLLRAMTVHVLHRY